MRKIFFYDTETGKQILRILCRKKIICIKESDYVSNRDLITATFLVLL